MSNQLSFVFLLCSSSLLSLDSVSPENNLNNYKSTQENPVNIQNKCQTRSFHQEKNPKIFSNEAIDELEHIFKHAPEEAQNIVSHITNNSRDQDYRFAIFLDDSELNHEAMAAAVAYKMYKQGWNCTFLSGKSVLGKNSDHTAIKLAAELKAIDTSNNPTLLVVHDLNQLLGWNRNTYGNSDLKDPLFKRFDDMENGHHHPELTNIVFWNFLQKQENNKKFFLIGTINNIQNLPEPIKHKMIMDIIEFSKS